VNPINLSHKSSGEVLLCTDKLNLQPQPSQACPNGMELPTLMAALH